MTELIFSKTRIFHVLKEDPVSFNQIIYGFSKTHITRGMFYQ